MKVKWLVVTGILGSFNVQSTWAWTVPLEEPGKSAFQKSVSQDLLVDIASDDLLVPEPLPPIKPKVARRGKRSSAAAKTLAFPGEHKPRPAQSFKKRPSELTGEEQVIANYAQALEFINKGMKSKAEDLLLNNLSILPSHLVSRIELANLYLKADQDLNAEQVVSQGLAHHQHPELLKLMALIMERRGELKEALDYLNKVPPQYRRDKNTVVLLGHLYQQAGHFTLARNQYHRLLEVEPNNPLWLLGVAMALEGEGKRQEALKSYRKLQSNPNLDFSLSQYVAERIASLKG